ncbi:MAG: hypothetical protein HZA51_12275 [Planctomycetes bacterium]|nr:hypothetical protein [Planctomycetota bacterium]
MAIGLNSIEHQAYRLALYGVRSSGKTCILSALSLPRVAHPEGFSCSWIEHVPGHPLPSGDPVTWTTDDPFHVGWKWLSEQRSRLKNGELPAPNPNRENVMRFLFEFGSRNHGTLHVELMDYSGELITASASELAAKLRDHMRDCDGLLVLAEVPYPGRDHAPLADDLEKLKGAFLLLLDERGAGPMQEWPIALLFNKWDRRADDDCDGDAQKRGMIAAFLNQSPQPPHASLVNTIRNAVGDDNYRCFPVSAFGAHEIRSDGAEVPRLNGPLLESRGLEDGFIWVAEQCDALRVKRLEDATSACSWWAFQQILLGTTEVGAGREQSAWKNWFRGVSAASAIKTAWKLRQRFPENSLLRIRTIGAMRKLGLKLASQVVVCFFVLVALFVGVETIFDGVSYRKILATRDDPAANTEKLQQGEKWLHQYFVSPGFCHWLSCQTILDRSEAHSLLVQFRTRRDETLWKTVTNAQNPQTHLNLVRKYLDSFPKGLHHSEAETLVADAERQAQETKNAEYLSQLKLKINAIPPTSTTQLDILHKLNEEIGTIPYPDVSSAPIVKLQQALRVRIAQKQTQVAEAERQADWETFKQRYFSLMQNKNVGDAARELESRIPKGADLQALVADFAKHAPSIIQGKVQDASKARFWQLARESARLSDNPNVVKLLPGPAIKELHKLGQEIDVAEDRDLYDQIFRYKPQCEDQIGAYLSRAPLKAMEAEVKEYRDWVTKRKGTMDLTLSLASIQWHDKYWAWRVNYYNDVTVTVKGKPVIIGTGILSKANTRSVDLGDAKLEAGLNETITIEVSVEAKHGWVVKSTMSGGSGTWTGTPYQLRSGVTIDLSGDGFTNKATFSLTGFPPEPPLPEWKKR